MNEYKIKIDFKNGKINWLGNKPKMVVGDYNSSKLIFEYNEEYRNYIKVFTLEYPSGLVLSKEIINNEIIIVGEDSNGNITSILTEDGDYLFNVSLYDNDSKLTTSNLGKFNVVSQLGEIEITPSELNTIDNLMNDLNLLINKVDNINIISNKLDNKTTITIKNKDNEITSFEIFDGDKGERGQDGYTPQKGIDYFDGLPGRDGVDGLPGKDGSDGEDGQNGYTPVRGQDYYTEEDKQYIIANVNSHIDELMSEIEERLSEI